MKMASEEASRGLSYQNHVGHIPYDILGNNGPGMIFVFFVLVSMLVVTVCWCVVKCYVLAEMETSSNEDYNRYKKIKDGKLETGASCSDHDDDDVIDVDVIPESAGNHRSCEVVVSDPEVTHPHISLSPNFNTFPYSVNRMRETCLHDYAQHHDDYLSDHVMPGAFQSHAFLSSSHPSLPVPSFSSSYHFTPV